ncbi:MAG: hypothetical protein ABWX85_15575, partial [Arthrobacter sp.]
APATGGSTTTGSGGLLSGTQIIAPITAPVSLAATSIGVAGDSTATTGTTGGTGQAATAPDTGGSTTTGSGGLLSGTQIIAPITAPVTLGATSIGLLGDSTATTRTTGTTGSTGQAATGGSTTTGSGGLLAGTQIIVTPSGKLPATVAVQAASPAAVGTLAYTGANTNLLWLAGLFLGAGMLIMMGVRMKKA